VNRLTVRQQDNTEKFSVHLCDGRPTPDAPVCLHNLFQRLADRAFNPFVANHHAVRPLAHRQKVLRAFYGGTAKFSNRFLHRHFGIHLKVLQTEWNNLQATQFSVR